MLVFWLLSGVEKLRFLTGLPLSVVGVQVVLLWEFFGEFLIIPWSGLELQNQAETWGLQEIGRQQYTKYLSSCSINIVAHQPHLAEGWREKMSLRSNTTPLSSHTSPGISFSTDATCSSIASFCLIARGGMSSVSLLYILRFSWVWSQVSYIHFYTAVVIWLHGNGFNVNMDKLWKISRI